MKPVLILQHQAQDHDDYLAVWLTNHNIPYQIINAGIGEVFPTSIEHYSALAVMGGAISVNDPLLSNHQAEILILQAFYRDIPVIGHCLGGQLMAKALGGKVSSSPKPEIGWQPIKYLSNSLVEEWFGTEPTDTVIHWHYESFSIPTGATLLATSEACPNQAFAIGKHLAMQFHIEINEDIVDEWVTKGDGDWASVLKYDSVQDKDGMLNGVTPYMKRHQATADKVYTNWLKTTIWAING